MLLLQASLVPAQTVQWRSDYGAARREAIEKNQTLVLVVSTENCGWCKHLENTTLRNSDVVGLLNQRFIPLKVSADDDRHRYLVNGLSIQGFPTIVLIAPNGKILMTQEGYVDAAGFLGLLNRSLASADRLEHRSHPAI